MRSLPSVTDLGTAPLESPEQQQFEPPAQASPPRPSAPEPTPFATPVGGRIDAVRLNQRAGRRQTLHEVSLRIEPGELVAIAGGSGAGKTTLLDILAGVQQPSAGQVRHDGVDVHTRAAGGARIGYVPQDDIIHREMPLRRTLDYAARLRMPAGTPTAEADRVVQETLGELDLADRSEVLVRALSGGQRKRASIAVELLTKPDTIFLDEPTSGLDPATAADVLRLLRRLSRRGVTVVLTAHDPASLERCDRVVFLARDGYLAFSGTPVQARSYFGVDNLAEIYDLLTTTDTPRAWAERFAASRGLAESPPDPAVQPADKRPDRRPDRRPGASVIRQWWLLTRRNADVLARNRLTLAVLLGSPVLVTAMMATLFRPGAFYPGDPADAGPAQTVFWIAFDGFFFGLTYGLLQIVGELAIFRRERLAGLSVGAYVAAKIAALFPVLVAVSILLLGALRALDRLPSAGWDVYASLLTTIIIEALSGLALGLLASAAVSNTAQAALALPMLCFPQVLFAGAVVPVADMAAPGRLLSFGLSTRYTFEALGHEFELGRYTDIVPSMGGYGDTFDHATTGSLLTLTAITIVLTLTTVWVLHRRSRRERPSNGGGGLARAAERDSARRDDHERDA